MSRLWVATLKEPAICRTLLQKLKYIPGAVDLRIQEPFNLPRLQVDIDRTRTAQVGFTPRDVASDMLVSLSGSFQTAPTFWLDPQTGVSYSIATQTPQYRVDSLQDLENIPITNSSGAPPADSGEPRIHQPRQLRMAAVSHYNVQPVINIYGAVQGRDLGGVARDLDRIVAANQEGFAARLADRRARTDRTPCAPPSMACWPDWSSPLCWSICSSW